MKKLVALLMALCMLLSMAAIASAEEYYIGVSIFDYSNNFVGYIRNGIEFYVKEINGAGGDTVKILITDGENNQAKSQSLLAQPVK